MSSTYRDSAKKLDNLFDDFMKKINSNPSQQSQGQLLHSSSQQLQQGSATSNLTQRNPQNINTYLNSSSPYNGTELPSVESRSLAHSNSAFQLYSQPTGTSSNGFQGGPPLPWKQNSVHSQLNKKGSMNQLIQQGGIQSQQNDQQTMKERVSNQENTYESEENNQYFHDTFQNIAGKDSIGQEDSLPSTSHHQNTFSHRQANTMHHQVSFNQKSIDGADSQNNRGSYEITSRADEMFPPAQHIFRTQHQQNQENIGLNSNINTINNYVAGSHQGSQFGIQNSRQNMAIFESNQHLTYGSQMTSKRQATEGSITLGYGTSITSTQRESKAYANAMKALQAKIRELQAQLDQKDKDIRNEKEQHQDNIFNMQTIINEREEELRETRRQFEENEKARKEMQSAFESGDVEKTEIFERMEADLSLLNTQLNECRNKQSKLKEELLSEKSTRQSLEEETLQLQQENQETKRSLHQLQAEHRLLQDEKDELNRKWQSEKMQKEEFQIKSESRQRDLQKMKEHYNEQLREFQNELNLLETNYSRKISDLEKRINVLQEENDEQKHLLDVKNTEIEQLSTNLYQKQCEWEDSRAKLLAKQRKLTDQIHSLKQHKASSTISNSSSRRHLHENNEEDMLLSSQKSRSLKKSLNINPQPTKKSRQSSTSRSPTPSKQSLPSFSNTASNTVHAINHNHTVNKNQSDYQQQTAKRNNNFNEIGKSSIKSNSNNELASSLQYSQIQQKSPISQSKAQNRLSQSQLYNQSQVAQMSSMRSSSQSPTPQSRSPNNISPLNRGHSYTLPSANSYNHHIHQAQQNLTQEGTARVGIVNQNNFDTPLFQNEYLRDRSSKDLAEQNGGSTINYENAKEQLQQQQIIQSTITQNEYENEEKGGGAGQNNDSFFYNQYVMGGASTSSNQNIQFANNSNLINNSRLNVSQLQNQSQIEQSQLNQSNNNISYTQSQNTVQNQNTNISTTTQGQESNDKYEFILKQIIEAEKDSISLSSQFQNILNESGKTEDSKKKHEYRGRLIELNEQINKNNQKLFALKRKEQEFLDQINGNY